MKTIFKAIVGSQAYGTATPQSDVDYKGVYMQPVDDLITFNYKPQIEKGKDECYYEVQRFLQLLQSANPTVIELLFMPDECIIEKSPIFDLIIAHRQKFLTKRCLNSFGGYAVAQIKKARGLDKKMNWEAARVERKTPIDFCYIYENGKTIPLEKWLKEQGKEQEYCGAVALNHFRDCYAIYYDYSTQYGRASNRPVNPLGFHGIIHDNSNELRLSSVPKSAALEAEAIMFYNKDGYSNHCRDYNEYQHWLNNRNTQRYTDNKGHNQQIDGKNLMHCRRLLDMAVEIAKAGHLVVRRPNTDYLKSIRKGEVPLKEIIDQAEIDLTKLDDLYAQSNLPDDVDKNFVNELLLEIRHAELLVPSGQPLA